MSHYSHIVYLINKIEQNISININYFDSIFPNNWVIFLGTTGALPQGLIQLFTDSSCEYLKFNNKSTKVTCSQMRKFKFEFLRLVSSIIITGYPVAHDKQEIAVQDIRRIGIFVSSSRISWIVMHREQWLVQQTSYFALRNARCEISCLYIWHYAKRFQRLNNNVNI